MTGSNNLRIQSIATDLPTSQPPSATSLVPEKGFSRQPWLRANLHASNYPPSARESALSSYHPSHVTHLTTFALAVVQRARSAPAPLALTGSRWRRPGRSGPVRSTLPGPSQSFGISVCWTRRRVYRPAMLSTITRRWTPRMRRRVSGGGGLDCWDWWTAAAYLTMAPSILVPRSQPKMIQADGKEGKEIPIPGVRKIPSYQRDYLPVWQPHTTYIKFHGGYLAGKGCTCLVARLHFLTAVARWDYTCRWRPGEGAGNGRV